MRNLRKNNVIVLPLVFHPKGLQISQATENEACYRNQANNDESHDRISVKSDYWMKTIVNNDKTNYSISDYFFVPVGKRQNIQTISAWCWLSVDLES